MARKDTSDYRALFLEDTPMMDTRAPVEFDRGAFPTAVSMPLMTDEERARVGTCYKEQGQAAAIELGHELVSGDTKSERLQRWCEFAAAHPGGYLYCFRGGLRSETVQAWMREAGVDYPRVVGGYKRMRRFLLENLEAGAQSGRFLLVAGKTGTGKTRVIQALPRMIDLESLANHRGSSFGRLLEGQPSQIDFENALSIALLRLLDQSATGPIFLEDEGRLIGRISLPETLRDSMQNSPLLVVEESVAERVQVIFEDYVIDLGRRYQEHPGDEPPTTRHLNHLRDGLFRIRKRLGGVLHAEIDARLVEAFECADREEAEALHRQWIESLLVKYYDPMYEYQMSRREGEVVVRGSREEIIAHAKELSAQ